MTITKEYLEEARADAARRREQCLADYNALTGAMQALELVLKRLDEPVPEPTPPSAASNTVEASPVLHFTR